MNPNDAEEIANSTSVDPDQTRGAIWSGSALFAQANLSENRVIRTTMADALLINA